MMRCSPRQAALAALGLAAMLAGCSGDRTREGRDRAPAVDPRTARALIGRTLPPSLHDRTGWAADVYAAFVAQSIAVTPENACAVAAVIEQESGFRVDPEIPGLPAIAWREIETRAAHAGVPSIAVHGVLQLPSADGRSYAERIDHARTEKELSDVYEAFIDALPLGKTLFADKNPIRTRGPMQVQATFAESYATRRPYPYPVGASIADEVFTRRGGLYFGVAHLLDYAEDHYDRYLYRFADFNAGQYASRNAAFQAALGIASGIPLTADGALLPAPRPAGPAIGATELAARSAAAHLGFRESQIHVSLERGKGRDFEQTPLYLLTFAAAERIAGHALPHAQVPRIELAGPKLSRRLTTRWYAERVDGRFQRCLKSNAP